MRQYNIRLNTDGVRAYEIISFFLCKKKKYCRIEVKNTLNWEVYLVIRIRNLKLPTLTIAAPK